MKQKGFSPILIVVGILLISTIVFGAYYLGTKNNKSQAQTTQPSANSSPTPTAIKSPAASPDETANWKTYTNNIFKYSIQYPDIFTKKPIVYEGEGGSIFNDVWSAKDNSYAITIYSYPDIYANTEKLEFNAKVETSTKVQVAGQSVKRILGKEIISDKGTLIHIGPVRNNSQNYFFTYSSGSQEAKQQDIDIFDKMVSSFKFTQ